MEHRRGILFMLFLMISTVAFLFLIPMFPAPFLSSLWFVIFQQIIRFLVPLALWLAFFKEKVNQHLPHMRLGTINIIYIIGLSLLLQPAMNVISGLTTIFFPNDMSEFVLEQMNQPYLLLILAIAVTPAICEEVIFRGYIQSTYKNKPLITMMLINGLFFGIMHLNPHQFLYAFIMGIIFAYMVHATRSIRAGIISHFIINASQITLPWVLLRFAGLVEDASEEFGIVNNIEPVDSIADFDFSQPEVIITFVILGIMAIGATVCAVILFREFAKHNQKRIMEYEMKIKKEVEEKTDVYNEETPEIISPQSPEKKLKNLLIDISLILVIVALYVILVIDI